MSPFSFLNAARPHTRTRFIPAIITPEIHHLKVSLMKESRMEWEYTKPWEDLLQVEFLKRDEEPAHSRSWMSRGRCISLSSLFVCMNHPD